MMCLVITALLTALPATAQEVGYNDLTGLVANPLRLKKFIPDSSCNGKVGGGFVSGIGCPPKTYPFELALLSVDTSELSEGSEAIVLLRLKDVGHKATAVPWLRDPDQIELPDDGGNFSFSEADLRANIVQDDGTTYIGIPVRLYGAKGVSDSLKEIRPGQYVEMRVGLVLDCKTAILGCRSLRVGPGKLSFTWTESDNRVTYEKCGTQWSQSRTRELTSNSAVMSIVGKVGSQ